MSTGRTLITGPRPLRNFLPGPLHAASTPRLRTPCPSRIVQSISPEGRASSLVLGRSAHSSPHFEKLFTTRHPSSWKLAVRIGLGAGIVTLGVVALAKPVHADADGDDAASHEWEEEDVPVGQGTGGRLASRPLSHLPFSALLRSYLVYTLCRFPALVDAAPTLIDWAETTSLPFVASMAHWIFRRTFFDQFVGGETAEDSMDVIRALDGMGLGTIFVYSVEFSHDKKKEKQSDASHVDGRPISGSALQEKLVDEILHSVEVGSAASSASSHDIMVAIKLSGLLRDPHILERASAAIVPRELFSRGPPIPTPPPPHTRSNTPHGALSIPLAALPSEEQAALRQLWHALRRVTMCVKEKGNVRLLIDAEYSWYQPAIDAMYEALAAEFNSLGDEEVMKRGPLVFNTYQAYLRRTPSFLSMSLERARAHGYALGVKLVRGAYVEIENKCWRDTVVDPPPTARATTQSELANEAWGSPVWPTKRHSDECFDACARLLVDEVANDWEAEQEARRKGKSEADARKYRRTAVIFASHNLQSGLKAIRRMVDRGLAYPSATMLGPDSDNLVQGSSKVQDASSGGQAQSTSVKETSAKTALVDLALAEGVSGRISFGQLYGMADTVSARLLAAFSSSSNSNFPGQTSSPSSMSSCMVYKYLPYGPLELVMPYLIRRATENKSVVGGGAAGREVAAVWAEMWRRLMFWG